MVFSHLKLKKEVIMMKETVRIKNECNEELCVEKYTSSNAKATIVFCHGITGCRKGRTMNDDYFQILALLLENRGYNVVLFDYSGHGESEGEDKDVCLSKSVSELKTVFENVVNSDLQVHFLAFSYGAAVLNDFLAENPNIVPKSMVLYSPCIFPLDSCFLTDKSVFGKDVYREYSDGTMKKAGYATVGVKGFRLGMKMIEECRTFSPDTLAKFSDRILVLSGRNDVILDTSYNTQFCGENHIENIWLDASHSLYEEIGKAFDNTINYFELK